MNCKPFLAALLAPVFVLAIIGPNNQALARENVPKFKDYPVTEIYKGVTAPLILTRDGLRFKTRLHRAAEKQKPNFAGRYILTTWGCGAECVMGAVIDAKAGRISWWNFTVCCWGSDADEKFNPIGFRLDSNLLVFSCLRNEKEGDRGAHFYRFENGRFIYIRSILTPKE
ncbi:MAG: hypothetical protein LAO31_20380 [Acidobacteriia bacterium]|nr:hypothetical protein [Terriglobia bacterium]